jgi:hypothetical protein
MKCDIIDGETLFSIYAEKNPIIISDYLSNAKLEVKTG